MKMDERVYPDIDTLSRVALAEVLRIIRKAIVERGRCAIALSGGHTPAKMFALWAQKYSEETPWDLVHLFWGDERYVPLDDPLSNFRMTFENLIAHVPIPAANVHPVPTELPTPTAAAEAYESELRNFFGSNPPAFDLQLQGLGVEGHTASLFPGSPVLEEKQRWVVAVEVAATPPRRLTLTPVVLNEGLNTFFLVAGKEKREILAALHGENEPKVSQYPAARLHPAGPVVWFLDSAAAGAEKPAAAGS
jgi:6-phosphogluconolactonase